jgi:AraC-like DNA-binding protein
MGAHFRPGGAVPFLRVAPSELVDGHGDADALGASRRAELRERLCAAASHAERFRILEGALLPLAVDAASARRGPLVAHAVARLARGDATVRAVVAELGVSHRHFASVFREAVGLTPKVFARIQRFQRALAALDSTPPGGLRPSSNPRAAPDWAGLAYAQGYCDQAHLIREFSALAGCAPRELLRRRSAPLKDHHVLAS